MSDPFRTLMAIRRMGAAHARDVRLDRCRHQRRPATCAGGGGDDGTAVVRRARAVRAALMLEDTTQTAPEPTDESGRAKRLPRSQRDKRKIAALSEENARLKSVNDELQAELVELQEVHAIALQNLDLYRRKGLRN